MVLFSEVWGICMNKSWKIIGCSFLSILVIIYVLFLALPFLVDLSGYMPKLYEIVKEQTYMDLNISNPKLITTPFLEVGFKADNIELNLSDGTPVIRTDKFKTKLFLPSLCLLTVKLSDLEVKDFNVILDTNSQATQYKLSEDLEKIINRINTEQNLKSEEEENGWFNPEWIRIKIPNIKISNYKVAVNDKKTNHSLSLKGDELKLGYFNGSRLKLKTYAYLMSDNKENISLNLKLDTFLPKHEKEVLDSDDDKAEKIELPFINIVKVYQNYDLKSHINSKLKLRLALDNSIKANGSFDVDNLTLRLSNYQLPVCYFHSKFSGSTADIDTNFYVTPDEKANISGKINYNKPSFDLSINSDKIHFNNLILFSKALLDSFGIRNDFADLTAKGFIVANAKIKTNFKKLKSDGKILIRDGALINNKIGLLITDTNSDLIFDESIFRIKNTRAYVSNTPFVLNGVIDNKTRADLNINTVNMPIVGLYNAFAPSDLKKHYSLKTGKVSINAKIHGKLQKSLSSVKFSLADLGISTPDNSIKINNGNLNLNFVYDLAENIFNGAITNKGFVFSLPSLDSVIKDSFLSIHFDNSNIVINPTSVFINDASQIKMSGSVSDYTKNTIIDIKGSGMLSANDLRKFAGKDLKPYIDAKGILPLKFQLTGNDKKQYFVTQILSNLNNYITPVHFDSVKGRQCITQLKINYKGDRLNIKDTGLYITDSVFGDDFSANMSGSQAVIKSYGTIAKLDTIEPRFNLFKIEIPHQLTGRIYAIRNSMFNLDGNVLVIGKIAKPFIHGGISVDNMNLPSMLTRIKSTGVKFNGYSMQLFANGIDLNGSDMDIVAHSNFEFAPVTKLFKFELNSNNFDLDRVMKVSELASKTLPQSSGSNVSNPSQESNIPLELTGRFLMRNIKTGDIKLSNTRGRIILSRNVLTLNPMMTNCFKGVVHGKIDTNLVTGDIGLDLRGHNLDMEQLLSDAAATKDAISGITSFEMKTSLKGSTYEEQMKSLKGSVNFSIINGGYGPIGKIENLILAENIRNSQFFQTALGGIINNIATIDTAHFTELSGKLRFSQGRAIIDSITSQGNVMCLHIAGVYDLLKNEADMKVRGRMGSFLSNMLGPIAMLNPVNLVKATPGINVVMAKAFTLFTVAITPEEMRAIPDFQKGLPDLTATKFQIILKGDAAKPLSMIKSFKWLATQSDIDNAQNFTDNMPEEFLLADPTTPEAQAAAALKAKEDARIINRIKRKFNKS